MPQPRTQPPTVPPTGATVHIYRGLMDRAVVWRMRIDAPTNWAIITGGAAVTFVLGNENHSHTMLLLVMIFTFGLLMIEARRILYYDLWTSWLRLLETEYYAPILRDNHVTMNETWQQMMVRDMEYPHFKHSYLQFIGRRLRDNYLAIYLFLILCWLFKLVIHPRPDLPLMAPDTFVSHAAIGPIPGVYVLIGVFCFYLFLLLLMLITYARPEPSIEVMPREQLMYKLASPAQQPMSRTRWSPEDIAHTHKSRYRRRNPID